MISNKQKKKRQHLKELNSLRNKMGSNIVWFDSLTKKKKYDLLFEWKREKHTNNLTKPETSKVWIPWTRQVIEVTNYPPNLKYFIKKAKKRYRVDVVRVREASIDLLLNNK